MNKFLVIGVGVLIIASAVFVLRPFSSTGTLPTVNVYFGTDVPESEILKLKGDIEERDDVRQVEYISREGSLEARENRTAKEAEERKRNELISPRTDPLGAYLKVNAINRGELLNLARYLDHAIPAGLVDSIVFDYSEINLESEYSVNFVVYVPPIVSVYFKTDASENEILAVKSGVEDLNTVWGVEYISKEDALKQFGVRYQENETIAAGIRFLEEQGDNPLNAYLEIEVKEIKDRGQGMVDYINNSVSEDLLDRVTFNGGTVAFIESQITE